MAGHSTLPASTPFVEVRVRQIVAEVIDVDLSRVTDDAYLVEDLGADVLDRIELEFKLEDEFRIGLDEEEIGRLIRISDISVLVRRKLDEAISKREAR